MKNFGPKVNHSLLSYFTYLSFKWNFLLKGKSIKNFLINDVFFLNTKKLCLNKLINLREANSFPFNACYINNKVLSIFGDDEKLFKISTEELII